MEIKISITKEKIKKIFDIIKKVYYIILPIVIIAMIIALLILNKKIESLDSDSKFHSNMLFLHGHAKYDIRSVGGKYYTYFNGYGYTISIYNKESTSEGTIYFCRFTNHYSITRSKIVLVPKIDVDPEFDAWYNRRVVAFEYDKSKTNFYQVELWNISPGQSVNFTIYVTSKMRDEVNKKIDEACEKNKQNFKGYDCNNVPIYFDFNITEEKI